MSRHVPPSKPGSLYAAIADLLAACYAGVDGVFCVLPQVAVKHVAKERVTEWGTIVSITVVFVLVPPPLPLLRWAGGRRGGGVVRENVSFTAPALIKYPLFSNLRTEQWCLWRSCS